jgi:hypothetical protein
MLNNSRPADAETSDATAFRLTTGYEPTVAGVTTWLEEQQLAVPRAMTSDQAALRVWRASLTSAMPAPSSSTTGMLQLDRALEVVPAVVPPPRAVSGLAAVVDDPDEVQATVDIPPVAETVLAHVAEVHADTDAVAAAAAKVDLLPPTVSNFPFVSTVPAMKLQIVNAGKRPLPVLLRDVRARGCASQSAVFGACVCGRSAPCCECTNSDDKQHEDMTHVADSCGCDTDWHAPLCDDVWRSSVQHHVRIAQEQPHTIPAGLFGHDLGLDSIQHDEL